MKLSCFHPRYNYLWDFWLIKAMNFYHLYYLQAPRNLGHPDMRHDNAKVGYAVSPNLLAWSEKGIVLTSGKKGDWDDISIWTGSIIQKQDWYYMFYTARSTQENGKIQRIGLAYSQNLIHWEKFKDNPLIKADSRWYETLSDSIEGQEHWRDPFIVYSPKEQLYYAFICARIKKGQHLERGCIARAVSSDLIHWNVMAPATEGGHFQQMEVPDIHFCQNKYYLIFSTDKKWYSKKHREEIQPLLPQTGAHYYQSVSLSSTFAPNNHHEILLGNYSFAYGSRVIENINHQNIILSWRYKKTGIKGFAGCLDQPKKVIYLADGSLTTINIS